MNEKWPERASNNGMKHPESTHRFLHQRAFQFQIEQRDIFGFLRPRAWRRSCWRRSKALSPMQRHCPPAGVALARQARTRLPHHPCGI